MELQGVILAASSVLLPARVRRSTGLVVSLQVVYLCACVCVGVRVCAFVCGCVCVCTKTVIMLLGLSDTLPHEVHGWTRAHIGMLNRIIFIVEIVCFAHLFI